MTSTSAIWLHDGKIFNVSFHDDFDVRHLTARLMASTFDLSLHDDKDTIKGEAEGGGQRSYTGFAPEALRVRNVRIFISGPVLTN